MKHDTDHTGSLKEYLRFAGQAAGEMVAHAGHAFAAKTTEIGHMFNYYPLETTRAALGFAFAGGFLLAFAGSAIGFFAGAALALAGAPIGAGFLGATAAISFGTVFFTPAAFILLGMAQKEYDVVDAGIRYTYFYKIQESNRRAAEKNTLALPC